MKSISLFATAIVLLGTASLAAEAQTTPSPKPQLVDSIVAVVNEDIITGNELAGRIQTLITRMQTQKAQIPPEADLRRQMLERMIVERVQIQTAKETGIRVDDANLDRAIARLAEQNRMSVQQFRDQIEREGQPFAAFREEVRDEITFARLREREVDNKINISDAEVDNFLASEAITAQTQQEFNLAQILVRIPENASPEAIASRRARAEQVWKQIKDGADFAKMAAANSDASDALSGGDLGWRSPERLPQLFFDAVVKLDNGQLAPLVKSPNGFHILKVLGKRSLPKVAGASTPSTVAQTHARHILIKVNQVVSPTDARRKLQDIKERLVNKAAKFEELAKSFSNDGSAAKGGDLGWLYPGDTAPEFEKAMDGLKVGELSDPIESPFGFHLIEVLERKSDDVSQERKRQEAKQTLRARKVDEGTEDYLRQLRDRAYVELRGDGK
jgi:peptidyl-prolyl cis-trans isomerase SurA